MNKVFDGYSVFLIEGLQNKENTIQIVAQAGGEALDWKRSVKPKYANIALIYNENSSADISPVVKKFNNVLVMYESHLKGVVESNKLKDSLGLGVTTNDARSTRSARKRPALTTITNFGPDPPKRQRKVVPASLPVPKSAPLPVYKSCLICNTPTRPSFLHQLGCNHIMCINCLTNTINMNFDHEGRVECPVKNCKTIIDRRAIQKILGSDFPIFLRKVELLMQEHQDRQLAEELDLENKTFIQNDEAFECQICYTDIQPGEGAKIKACRHQFCKNCLSQHIKLNEDVEIKCPFIDENGNCDKIIEEGEIRRIATDDVIDIYYQRSLKHFEGTSNTFHCIKPDCVGFYEIADAFVRRFRCQVCHEINCIECKAIHTGKTCQEYRESAERNREVTQSEEAIQKLVDEKKAMYCPNCRIPVMKVDGCDAIKCGACRLLICWVTQKPRLPLTRSDGVFIDGCHCDFLLKKCHPNCRNCH